MRTIIFLLCLVAQMAGANPGDLVRQPKAGECIPEYPQAKEYIDPPERRWIYTHVTFRCIFHCKADSGEFHEVIGTQKVKFLFEDGHEMVCKGYDKDMKWVPLTTSTERHGYYTIGKRRPFKASRSKIPELLEWARD